MENNVRKKLEKINIRGKIEQDIPMNLHTTFKTGGKADFYAVPSDYDDLIKLMKFAREYNIPLFILGGGANILVSDRGIRGLVIDMKKITNFSFDNTTCRAEAGLSISDLAESTAVKNLQGLDFIYGMPGTVGGAVWMNARCYEVSISDILIGVDYLDENLEFKSLKIEDIQKEFSYKQSPFQNTGKIIISVTFKLHRGNKNTIWENMKQHKEDRENKGHYKYPSAGSVFKNNRTFGKPTGIIIDSLGLKGYSKGAAEIADFHGNIIVNKGKARSEDIRSIIDYTEKLVYEKTGFQLEPEIQFIGDWG